MFVSEIDYAFSAA